MFWNANAGQQLWLAHQLDGALGSGPGDGDQAMETKYYFFAGQRVAMKRDGILAYLHTD